MILYLYLNYRRLTVWGLLCRVRRRFRKQVFKSERLSHWNFPYIHCHTSKIYFSCAIQCDTFYQPDEGVPTRTKCWQFQMLLGVTRFAGGYHHYPYVLNYYLSTNPHQNSQVACGKNVGERKKYFFKLTWPIARPAKSCAASIWTPATGGRSWVSYGPAVKLKCDVRRSNKQWVRLCGLVLPMVASMYRYFLATV